MSLFDHGEAEEFILFVQNFNMTLTFTGTLKTDSNIQYICMLVRGEELRQFDLMSSDVTYTDTSLNVDYPLKGLA